MTDLENHQRGWVHGKNHLPACKVYLDGTLIKNVVSANRKKGRIKVAYEPLRVDKHGKRVLTHTLRGHVQIEVRP